MTKSEIQEKKLLITGVLRVALFDRSFESAIINVGKEEIKKIFNENEFDSGSYKKMLEQYMYTVYGGRRFRPTLLFIGSMLSNQKFDSDLMNLAVVIELIHKYSLVIDDFIDNDSLRRNRQTTHVKYDEKTAVRLSTFLSYLYIKTLMKICSKGVNDKSKDCEMELANEILSDMSVGAMEEIHARKEQKYLSKEEVLEIERKQTSTIIKNSLRIGYIHNNPNGINDAIDIILSQIGNTCGMIFQLINDIENFLPDEYQKGNKGHMNSDLECGAKNYVVSLISEEFQKSLSIEDKIKYIKEHGLVNQVLELIYAKFDEVELLLQQLPISQSRTLLETYMKHERNGLSNKLSQTEYKRSDKILDKRIRK